MEKRAHLVERKSELAAVLDEGKPAQGQNFGQVALVMLLFGIGTALPLLLVSLISRRTLMLWRTRMMTARNKGKRALGGAMAVSRQFAQCGRRARANDKWITRSVGRPRSRMSKAMGERAPDLPLGARAHGHACRKLRESRRRLWEDPAPRARSPPRCRRVLPYVSGDGDHGLSRQWRNIGKCAGDGGSRKPSHDEALRPHR